jgi:anti-sigma B factor antagonist
LASTFQPGKQLWQPQRNISQQEPQQIEDPMIDYTTHQVSDAVTVVDVSGTLNESNRKYFFDCIGDMIDSGSRYIIIECHRLGHLSSASLASLLTAKKHAAKKGGRIYLTHLSSSIAEVLEITKLGRLLSVYPSTESAIEHIQNDSACAG